MKRLRILHLEDDPIDGELLSATLVHAGLSCDIRRVDTKADFVRALADEPFDLVISDLSLPSFDGRSALEIVRREYPDVPFIFVSGTMGEESAIESLLSGATDYVLKQKFSRLVPAVQRAQREAEERKLRRRTEQELALASTQLQHLFGNLDDVFFSVDAVHRRLLLLSPSCERITGRPPDAYWANPSLWDQCIHSADRSALAEVESTLRTGRPVQSEFRAVHLDRSVRWIEAKLKPVIDQAGRLVRVDGVVRDVTARKQSEEAVRASEARYRQLFENNPHPMWVCDGETRAFLAVNDAAVELYGYSRAEFLGMTDRDILAPGQSQTAENPSAAGGFERVVNERHKTKDGRVIDVEIVSHHLPFEGRPARLSLATDVTERKRIESQLLRAQRIETIGALASGVAHDLNNILAPILMGLQLLKDRYPDDKSRRTLDSLDSSARRGADLVRQVLTFARGIESQRGPLQIRHLFRDVEKILVETLPRSIRMQTDAPLDLSLVMGDGTQLHQLLMNLCINARDAMPRGGVLSLSARNQTLEAKIEGGGPDARPAPYVVIEVSDTGQGIPQELLEKIFEPFFTTKPLGKGTGLGLSTVQTIVEGHGGFLDVSSVAGTGTRFTVYLPAAASQRAEEKRDTLNALPAGNGELVLIVDDEVAIRDIAQATLEAYGYKVVTASNGAEGLQVLEEYGDEIRIVLSDMNMPVMDGQTMIQSMEQIQPDLRFVAASGMPQKTQPQPADASSRRVSLRKPFTASELLQAMNVALKSS